VPSPRSARSTFSAPACVPGVGKGGELRMFKSLVALKREDGQTMAEYGVVLAVITLAIVVALAALSGAIGDAINAVTGVL
jgi:Flp pilus assembly pilin Flp